MPRFPAGASTRSAQASRPLGVLLAYAIDRHARLSKVAALPGGPEGMSVALALTYTDERLDAASARLEAKCARGASETG